MGEQRHVRGHGRKWLCHGQARGRRYDLCDRPGCGRYETYYCYARTAVTRRDGSCQQHHEDVVPAHKAISCAHLTRAFKEGDREGRNSVTVWKVPQFITYRYTVYNTDGTVRCVIELLIVSAPRKGRY